MACLPAPDLPFGRPHGSVPADGPVVTICRALDGIPLAIELAAGRLRSLSLPDLAARLDDQLLMMTHGKDSPARLNGRSEL
jgi:predicted ATPase